MNWTREQFDKHQEKAKAVFSAKLRGAIFVSVMASRLQFKDSRGNEFFIGCFEPSELDGECFANLYIDIDPGSEAEENETLFVLYDENDRPELSGPTTGE